MNIEAYHYVIFRKYLRNKKQIHITDKANAGSI